MCSDCMEQARNDFLAKPSWGEVVVTCCWRKQTGTVVMYPQQINNKLHILLLQYFFNHANQAWWSWWLCSTFSLWLYNISLTELLSHVANKASLKMNNKNNKQQKLTISFCLVQKQTDQHHMWVQSVKWVVGYQFMMTDTIYTVVLHVYI